MKVHSLQIMKKFKEGFYLLCFKISLLRIYLMLALDGKELGTNLK